MSTELRPATARKPFVLTRAPWSVSALVRLVPTALALVLACAWLDSAVFDGGPPPAFDTDVLGWFAANRTAAAIGGARLLSTLGDGWVAFLIAGAAVTFAWRHGGRRHLAVFVGLVVGGVLALTGIIKAVTDRGRPDEGLLEALSFAFPSGHAARGAAVATLLVWLAWRWIDGPLARWSAVAAFVMLGAGIGLSRLVLGVHWPSDVVFGWGLGVAWTVAAILATRPHRAAAS